MIDKLPTDVRDTVFGFLPFEAFLSLKLVSKKAKQDVSQCTFFVRRKQDAIAPFLRGLSLLGEQQRTQACEAFKQAYDALQAFKCEGWAYVYLAAIHVYDYLEKLDGKQELESMDKAIKYLNAETLLEPFKKQAKLLVCSIVKAFVYHKVPFNRCSSVKVEEYTTFLTSAIPACGGTHKLPSLPMIPSLNNKGQSIPLSQGKSSVNSSPASSPALSSMVTMDLRRGP